MQFVWPRYFHPYQSFAMTDMAFLGYFFFDVLLFINFYFVKMFLIKFLPILHTVLNFYMIICSCSITLDIMGGVI